jgi:hypothetical protein
VNRRNMEQLSSIQSQMQVLTGHRRGLDTDRARRQVFEGTREWEVLSLAVEAQWDLREELVGLMEQLPGAVLRRAREERCPHEDEQTCPTCMYVDLVARPPSETIAKEVKEVAKLARSRAQAEEEPFYAMAQAYLAISIQRDPKLKKTRKLCWRKSGPGWRLSGAVTRAAADALPTSGHPGELAELNSEGLFDGQGFWLLPAIVLEGGELLRRPDVGRPPVDLAVLLAEAEMQEQRFAEVLQQIFGERRSKQVKTGQGVLPDLPDRPSGAPVAS